MLRLIHDPPVFAFVHALRHFAIIKPRWSVSFRSHIWRTTPVAYGSALSRRTPELAARFADVWNGILMGPDTFRDRSATLDVLLTKHGRRPDDVKRTVAALCFFGRTEDALTRRVQPAREWDAELAPLSLEETLETLRTGWGAIAGSPEVVIEQIRACERAGVEELMLEWFPADDVEGAAAFAADVLSRL